MDREIANGDRVLLEVTREKPQWAILFITLFIPSIALIVLFVNLNLGISIFIMSILFFILGIINYYVSASRDNPHKMRMKAKGICSGKKGVETAI